MNSIDNRVVRMEFDNREFEEGIAQTILSLDRLKESLNFEGVAKGFDDLAKFNNGSTNGIEEGIKQASNGFSNMQVVGYTALSELTKGAMGLGVTLLKSIAGPLAQIDSGGRTRALKIEQAKFQMQGLGLDVALAMQNALDAVDGTAYGLDSAAKAAGQLAASGVQLGADMTQSLRGIAGLAAMTGSDFDSVAQIFTKVSGNGRLMGMELNQLSSYGVNAAAVLAKHFGVTEAALREMVTKGQVSFDMFSEAMSASFGDQAKKANDTFSGALMNMQAALSRIGEKFFTPYYENMRQIFNAIRPLINAFNKELGPIFKGIEALMVFSRSNTVAMLEKIDLTGMGAGLVSVLIPAIEIVRNVVGGLLEIVERLSSAFRSVFPAVTFKAMAKVLEYLSKLTSGFGLTKKNLDLLERSLSGFYSVLHLAGLGLGMLVSIFAKVGSVLGTALRPVGILLMSINAIFGDFWTTLDKAISSGASPLEALSSAFNTLKKSLGKSVGPQLTAIGDAFAELSDKIKKTVEPLAPVLAIIEKGITAAVGGIAVGLAVLTDVFKNLDFNIMPLKAFGAEVESSLEPLSQNGSTFISVSESLKAGLANVREALTSIDLNFTGGAKKVGEVLAIVFGGLASALQVATPIFKGAGDVISYLFGVIKKSFEGVNSVDIVNSGFFAALVIVIAKFLKPLRDFTENITGTLDEVCNSLKAYQTDLKGDMLMKIAGSVLMLAGAFWIMAQVPKEKLVTTLYAMSILLAELVLSLLFLSEKVGQGKLMALSFSMVVLSAAVLILAQAVASLGKLNWKQVALGTTAISLLLWELVGISAVLSKYQIELVKGSASLLLFSTSLYIMATAIRKLGEMDMKSLAVGLAAIAALLLTLGVFMRATKGAMLEMPAFAAGLLLMSGALMLLVLPLLALGKIPYQILIQGLTVITAMLTIVAFAANAMQKVAPQMATMGFGLLLMGVALNSLLAPLLVLSYIPLEVIGRGLLLLVGMMSALAIGALLMAPIEGNLIAVAAGLTILAVAINLLLIPIAALSAMPIEGIIVALTALAGLFLVLGVASIALAPVGAGLLLVSGSIALLGIGLYLAGAGFVALAAGIGAMGLALTGVVQMLPIFLKALGDLVNQLLISLTAIATSVITSVGVVIAAFVKTILQIFIDSAPKLIEAATIFLNGVLQVLIDVAPKFFEGMNVLITGLIAVIVQQIPAIVTAGIGLLLGFLEGIYAHIEKIAQVAANIIVKFIDGIRTKLPALVQAGFDLIISFIDTLAVTVTENSQRMTDAFFNLAGAMIDGVANGLLSGGTRAVEAVKGLGSSLIAGFKDVLGIHSPSKVFKGAANAMIDGLKNGLTGGTPAVVAVTEAVGTSAVGGIESGGSGAKAAGKEIAEEALKGVRETSALISVSEGKYLADGVVIGIVSAKPDMYEASKFLALAIQKGIVEEAPMFTNIGETTATKFLEGMTEEAIIAKAWAAGIKVSSTAWEGAKDTAEAMAEAGTAAGQAYIDGLNKAADDAAEARRKLLANIAGMSASGELGRQNAARLKAKRDGVAYIGQMTNEEAKAWLDAGGTMGGDEAVDAMRNAGENVTNGLAEGITNGFKTAEESMTILIKGVVQTAKDGLGIKSPSKVFNEIGRFTAIGFIDGLSAMSNNVVSATKMIGTSSIESIKSAISKIADVVGSDIDYAPVIRPVLDLNNLQNGISSITDMFGAKNDLAVQISNDKNSPGKNSENVNDIDNPNNQSAGISFIQNNYSPTPLSRLDIYRQTKNQFSAVKGMVNS